MDGFTWKARIESALSGVGRDLHNMVRRFAQYLEGLQTSEKLVLAGVLMMGMFFLLLHHFQGRREGEEASVRFVGSMFLFVAVAAVFGWMASGQTV